MSRTEKRICNAREILRLALLAPFTFVQGEQDDGHLRGRAELTAIRRGARVDSKTG